MRDNVIEEFPVGDVLHHDKDVRGGLNDLISKPGNNQHKKSDEHTKCQRALGDMISIAIPHNTRNETPFKRLGVIIYNSLCSNLKIPSTAPVTS